MGIKFNIIQDTRRKYIVYELDNSELEKYDSTKQYKVTIYFKDINRPLNIFYNKRCLLARDFIGNNISFCTYMYSVSYHKNVEKPLKVIKNLRIMLSYSDTKFDFNYTNYDIYNCIDYIDIKEVYVPSIFIYGCSHSYNHPLTRWFSWAQYITSKIKDKTICNFSASGTDITLLDFLPCVDKKYYPKNSIVLLHFFPNDAKRINNENKLEDYISNCYIRQINKFVEDNNKVYVISSHGYSKNACRDKTQFNQLIEILNKEIPNKFETIDMSYDEELTEIFKKYNPSDAHTEYHGAKYLTEKYILPIL